MSPFPCSGPLACEAPTHGRPPAGRLAVGSRRFFAAVADSEHPQLLEARLPIVRWLILVVGPGKRDRRWLRTRVVA